MSHRDGRIINAQHRAKRQQEVEALLRSSLTAGERWRWHVLSEAVARVPQADARFTDGAADAA
jgi:hypothetical protein